MCVPSHFSCAQLFATSWTAACQAPLSMGFFRQEDWSGSPFPSPGDSPDLTKGCSLSSESLPNAMFQFNTGRVLNSVQWGSGKLQAQDPKNCPRNAIPVIVDI